MGQARKVGHRGIEMIEIRNVDLPVVGHHGARQVSAADPNVGSRIGRANPLGDGADAVFLCELAAFGELDRDAGRAKQPRSRLGDQLQRACGIAGSVGNCAQDLGARLLLEPRGLQQHLQARDLRGRRRLWLAGRRPGRFPLDGCGGGGFARGGLARSHPVATGRRAALSRVSPGPGHTLPCTSIPSRAAANAMRGEDECFQSVCRKVGPSQRDRSPVP